MKTRSIRRIARCLFSLLVTSALPGRGQSVVEWGNNYWGTAPAWLTDVVAVDGGYEHSLALRSNGTVAAWGWSYEDETEVPVGLTDVVAIAAGEYSSRALQSNGAVRWTSGGIPQGVLGDVVATDLTWNHRLDLLSNGFVVGWGWKSAAAVVPPTLSDVVAIGAGAGYSLALRRDGTVVGWGNNPPFAAVPEGLTNIVAIAAGWERRLALRGDGTVVGWGSSSDAIAPGGLSNVVAIAVGGLHSLALRSDGTVFAWGYNVSGQATVPAGLANVVAIAAGYTKSLAIVAPPSSLPGSRFAITTADGAPYTLYRPRFYYRVPHVAGTATFSATGLPPGLSMDSITGVISGTALVPGQFEVSLTAVYGDHVKTGLMTLNVIPARNVLSAWQLNNWPAGDPDSGMTRDPDGDGVTNFAEFVTGTDPTRQSSPPEITLLRDAAGSLVLSLDVVPASLSSTNVTAEFSDNLAFSPRATVVPAVEFVPGQAGRMQLTFSDPARRNPPPRRWARLRFTVR